jgi:hypothetical protein
MIPPLCARCGGRTDGKVSAPSMQGFGPLISCECRGAGRVMTWTFQRTWYIDPPNASSEGIRRAAEESPICCSCGNGFADKCPLCGWSVCAACAEHSCLAPPQCLTKRDASTLDEVDLRFVAETAPHHQECDCAVRPVNRMPRTTP